MCVFVESVGIIADPMFLMAGEHRVQLVHRTVKTQRFSLASITVLHQHRMPSMEVEEREAERDL